MSQIRIILHSLAPPLSPPPLVPAIKPISPNELPRGDPETQFLSALKLTVDKFQMSNADHKTLVKIITKLEKKYANSKSKAKSSVGSVDGSR